METQTRVENPLLDVWESVWGIDWETRANMSRRERLDHEHKMFMAKDYPEKIMSHYRDDRRHRYSWAIPTPEALELIASYAPIVEIGAGAGYWANLLRKMKVGIRAFDSNPLNRPDSYNHWHKIGDPKPWTYVARGGPRKAARYSDHTLFLCWPPMSNMAYLAFKNYMEAGGETLIYIGEGEGGCTADEKFFTLVDEWDKERIIDIPQWAGLHDRLYVYKRKEGDAHNRHTEGTSKTRD